MKQALDELKAIPGVVGVCLFGVQEGLILSNLPGIFKSDKLTEVGRQLSKLLAAGRMSFDDLNDLSLHYDESVLIARQLQKGLSVFALCDPSFNHNLLTMSFNLLQEELNDQLDRTKAMSLASAETSVPEVASEIEPLMMELKSVLAKVLGPMASIIFDEVRHEWSQRDGSTAQLGDLLALLNQEIGDPDKIATFEALAAPLLKK